MSKDFKKWEKPPKTEPQKVITTCVTVPMVTFERKESNMSDDLIKREEAIKALKRWFHGKGWMLSNEDVKAILWDIPSADRPQGKWVGGEIPTKCPICEHDWDEYVFGQEVFYTGDIPKYCPNCGARMKGADDER